MAKHRSVIHGAEIAGDNIMINKLHELFSVPSKNVLGALHFTPSPPFLSSCVTYLKWLKLNITPLRRISLIFGSAHILDGDYNYYFTPTHVC